MTSNHSKISSCLVIGFAVLVGATVCAEDWTRFRGESAAGISPKAAPTKWGPKENIKWSADLPGAGVSCPIIIGDKVFVTCYSGYGLDRRSPGDIADLKRHVVCVERKSGKLLWSKTCLLYTSPSPRDLSTSRMPSSA